MMLDGIAALTEVLGTVADAREEWRPVVGWEGYYEVSDQGRVRSLPRVVPHGRHGSMTVKGRILRAADNSSGYVGVALCRDCAPVTQNVHSLVLTAFIGPRPEGMEGCHNDGNRMNNRLQNLRWDSPLANHADKRLHGTIAQGERHGLAKLTEQQVREIRRLQAQGHSQRSIAARFGVTDGNVSFIVRRMTWAHLD